MIHKALAALGEGFLCSLLFGGLGVVAGFLLGAMLRLMWGLLAFLATGVVVSLVPQTDWIRVAAGRIVGAVGLAVGALGGGFNGWNLEWNMGPSRPWTDDKNQVSPMGL